MISPRDYRSKHSYSVGMPHHAHPELGNSQALEDVIIPTFEMNSADTLWVPSEDD